MNKLWPGAVFALLSSHAFAQASLAPGNAKGFVSAATTNCQSLASGAAAGYTLEGVTMGNTGAAAWIKFYDMAGTPTAGALQGSSPGGVPYIFPVPGATALAGSNIIMADRGTFFRNGIAFCVTGGAANADTTAVAAAQITGTIFYH